MGLVTVSQAIAHGITKGTVEMMDLKVAEPDVKELVSIASGLVIGTHRQLG